jgi:hypothetical protein
MPKLRCCNPHEMNYIKDGKYGMLKVYKKIKKTKSKAINF